MTLASSPIRISAVIIASCTCGTCSLLKASASAGTAFARPPSARAALHRVSASKLPKAAIGDARASSRCPSSVAGLWTLCLTKGTGSHPLNDCCSDVLNRPDQFGPPVPDKFARHAPDDCRGFRLRDCSPTLLAQPRHRRSAVASHAGHHDSNQLRRFILLEGACYHPLYARMPKIVASPRDRHGTRRRCGDQIG